MAGAPKRPTHVVVHPNLFMKGPEGKLQPFPKGHQLTLSAEQAKKLGHRVAPLDGDSTDLTKSDKEDGKDAGK